MCLCVNVTETPAKLICAVHVYVRSITGGWFEWEAAQVASHSIMPHRWAKRLTFFSAS